MKTYNKLYMMCMHLDEVTKCLEASNIEKSEIDLPNERYHSLT